MTSPNAPDPTAPPDADDPSGPDFDDGAITLMQAGEAALPWVLAPTREERRFTQFWAWGLAVTFALLCGLELYELSHDILPRSHPDHVDPIATEIRIEFEIIVAIISAFVAFTQGLRAWALCTPLRVHVDEVGVRLTHRLLGEVVMRWGQGADGGPDGGEGDVGTTRMPWFRRYLRLDGATHSGGVAWAAPWLGLRVQGGDDPRVILNPSPFPADTLADALRYVQETLADGGDEAAILKGGHDDG